MAKKKVQNNVQVRGRLEKIDSFFSLVNKRIPGKRILPTNVPEVRAKFFKRIYNPVFTYNPYPEHLESYDDILSLMDFGDSPYEKLFKRKCDGQRGMIALQRVIGTPKMTAACAKLYAKPSKSLIGIAERILTLPKSPKDERFLKRDAVKLLRTCIKEMGISWKIQTKKLVTSANVNVTERKLELNKGESLAHNYTKRLAIHEVGTHILRAENGALQKYHIFREGCGGYLQTEEGLAVYNELISGLLTASTLRNYAGRVLAVSYALESDFVTTFRKLRKHFDKHAAFKLTLRAKRGLVDTSKPGAFTKDVVYLRGFLEVLAFAKNHDVSELYVGKIGLGDISTVLELNNLVPPKHHPYELLEKGLITPSPIAVTQEEIVKLVKGK